MEKKYFLLTSGGIDSKGTVFRLTKILKKHGFNIEDSSMMLLRHTFSMIVLLSHGPGFKGRRLEKFKTELKTFSNKYGMAAGIKAVSPEVMDEYSEEGSVYTLSISGADKPGIVNTITGILFKRGVNIIDMETKSSQKTVPAAYYMLLEIDVPGKADIGKLSGELKAAGKKIGVHVSVNRVESAVL